MKMHSDLPAQLNPININAELQAKSFNLCKGCVTEWQLEDSSIHLFNFSEIDLICFQICNFIDNSKSRLRNAFIFKLNSSTRYVKIFVLCPKFI